MRTRSKVFIGWLAFELAALPLALPAFASFKNRVSFQVKQTAIVQPVSSTNGEQSFLVASNGPFAVLSEGFVGEISVMLSQNGLANGMPYGSKSQMPGLGGSCGFATSFAPTRIYTAQTKTAQERGSVAEQSVLVTIHFDPALTPNLTIKPMDQAGHALLAMPCDGRNS